MKPVKIIMIMIITIITQTINYTVFLFSLLSGIYFLQN